jgi:hypothetical protein
VDKSGLHSEKLPITFESHLGGLNDAARKALLDLRTYVLGLGNNVIEQIRPHRIVYAKSLTFRTFLDIRPANDSLVIAVRKNRCEPTVEHTIMSGEDLESIKHEIGMAFKTIE